jgi:type I restriction enzyme, R subunit
MIRFTESVVEEAVLEWAEGLGYAVLHGPEIAPGDSAAERASYNDIFARGTAECGVGPDQCEDAHHGHR